MSKMCIRDSKEVVDVIKKDLVIIGAGPAGMCAAASAYENGIRDILILEREHTAGGILKPVSYTHLDVYKRQEHAFQISAWLYR